MNIKKEFCNLETLKQFGDFESKYCGCEGLFFYEIENDTIILIDTNNNGHCQINEYDYGWLEYENEVEEYFEGYERYKDNHEYVIDWDHLLKIVNLFNKMKEAGIVQ